MLRELRLWLGEARLRALVILLGVTGLTSLLMQVAFPGVEWSLAAQTILFLLFLAGALVIIGGRLPPFARQRLAFRFVPAMVAVLLGLVFQDLFQLFLGGALGWLLVAQFLMRDVEKREYKIAVRALRHREYDKGIDAMSELIRQEPEEATHYAFRAQLHRLNKDVQRAAWDYKQVLKFEPKSGVGQNGLAELSLQEGNLTEARKWAEEAYQQVPENWVAAYNLGMVAERQKDDAAAQQVLETVLKLGLPDSRHRLLTNLWLARVYYRQGETDLAQSMVEQLKRERAGLSEWQTILESKEADTMRHLMEADIQQAAAFANGKVLYQVFDAG